MEILGVEVFRDLVIEKKIFRPRMRVIVKY